MQVCLCAYHQAFAPLLLATSFCRSDCSRSSENPAWSSEGRRWCGLLQWRNYSQPVSRQQGNIDIHIHTMQVGISSTHTNNSPSNFKGTYFHGERGGGEGAVQADRQPGDSYRRTGALEPQTGQAASFWQYEEYCEWRHCQVRTMSNRHNFRVSVTHW